MKAASQRARALPLFILSAALAILGGAGCSDALDNVSFRLDTTPPLGVVMTGERIEIPVGIAVGATALPEGGGEELSITLGMRSSDPTVFGVEGVMGNQFIFYGTFPGSTTLRIVEVNGGSAGGQVDIPVKVIEQGP
jgi:hypothetical protein